MKPSITMGRLIATGHRLSDIQTTLMSYADEFGGTEEDLDDAVASIAHAREAIKTEIGHRVLRDKLTVGAP